MNPAPAQGLQQTDRPLAAGRVDRRLQAAPFPVVSTCLLRVRKILLKFSIGTSPLLSTSGPVMWDLRRGFSTVHSGSASNWQEFA